MGLASVIDSSKQYSQVIRPKETNGFMSKYTKIKTLSLGAQLARFKSVFRWAIVQGRILLSSIPCHEIEKTTKRGKSGPKNGEFGQNDSKTTGKLKKHARKIGKLKLSASFGDPSVNSL